MRAAVRRSITALIFLDAAACYAGAGPFYAILVAVLVVPTTSSGGGWTEGRTGMLLGYNTNGMAHHDLFDAVELLADIGYAERRDHHRSHGPVAARPLQSPADPAVAAVLQQRKMRTVIETGARFLLDPREKHEPTLISRDPAGRRRRIDFYKYAVDTAAELGSDCVSLWSGRLPAGVERSEAIAWLVDGLRQVGEYAARQHVSIAFEPEPGMLIDTMAALGRTAGPIGHGRPLPDPGHRPPALPGRGSDRRSDRPLGLATGQRPHRGHAGRRPRAPDVRRRPDRFPPVFRGLSQIGYAGGVHVELSRHSHEAPAAAQKAYDFLQTVLEGL